MALILDGDGHPVFIPTQGRARRRRSGAPVSSGKLVKHPFGWYVKYPDGTVEKAVVQRAKEKGVKAIQDPRSGSTLRVVMPSRRRRRLRKILGKYLLNPYILGALTGFGLPKLLTTQSTVLVGTGIAVGGYFSPTGSYMRKFSVGAGLGAGLEAGIRHGELVGVVAEAGARIVAAVNPKLGVVGAVIGGVLTKGSKLGVIGGGAAGAFGIGALREIPNLAAFLRKKLYLKTAYWLQDINDAFEVTTDTKRARFITRRRRRRDKARGR